jgi:hypothetical protein
MGSRYVSRCITATVAIRSSGFTYSALVYHIGCFGAMGLSVGQAHKGKDGRIEQPRCRAHLAVKECGDRQRWIDESATIRRCEVAS